MCSIESCSIAELLSNELGYWRMREVQGYRVEVEIEQKNDTEREA